MKKNVQNDADKKSFQNIEKKDKLEKLFTYLYEDLKNRKDKKSIIDTSLNFIYDVAKDSKGPNGDKWIKRFKASIYETEIQKSLIEVEDNMKNKNIEKLDNVITKKIQDIKKIDSEIIPEIINTSWKNQIEYISKLHEEFKNVDSINNLVIYEAPPSKIDISRKTHVGDFILMEESTSPYKYAINNAFGMRSGEVLSKTLVENHTYFMDIIPVPIPFNPDIRKAWATDEKFKIEEKQLTVHLFEKAIEKFAFKFKDKIHKNLKIAIGMPRNTSAALYDYYSSEVHYVKEKGDKIFIERTWEAEYLFKIDLRKTNADLAKEKIKYPTLKGITLPLFESCFVDTSGQPNSTLLKIALGLEI
jgi:hypothetical protein